MSEPFDAPSLPAHRIGVLVVEDEPLVAMDLADRLEDAGLAVFEARHAGEAEEPVIQLPVRQAVQALPAELEQRLEKASTKPLEY